MSVEVVRVMPVEGRLILMPDRGYQAVPAEGARVYLDAFYTRAINQGDLTVADEPTPLPETPSPTTKD